MSNDIKNNRVLCNLCNKEFGRYEEYVLFGALNPKKTIRVGGVLLCNCCSDIFMDIKNNRKSYIFMQKGVSKLIEKCNGQ